MRNSIHLGVRLASMAVFVVLLADCEGYKRDAEIGTLGPPAKTMETPSLSLRLPTRTPYYAPQPSSATFIQAVAPPPGSILNIQDFRDGKHNGGASWHVAEPNAPSICAKVDAARLMVPGDDFSRPDQLLRQIEVIVDDQLLPAPDGIDYVATKTWLEDEAGNEVAVAAGPFFFCWHLDLNPGNHTARIKGHKTSGEVLGFEWSFRLTSD
jgi:hypothetical protein